MEHAASHEPAVPGDARTERAVAGAAVGDLVDRGNRNLMLLALFGCELGQAVLVYASIFYAYHFHFHERIARPNAATVTALAGIALVAAVRRLAANSEAVDHPAIVAILVPLLLLASACTDAYAPMLVEHFRTRIRYSGPSFAQIVGNGWFGGMLPAVPFAITASCFVVTVALLTEVRGRPNDKAPSDSP